MRGRGVVTARLASLAHLHVAALSLALIFSWPITGAGTKGGDHRVAISLAMQVDASAKLIVGAKPEGRHWPGG